MNKFLFQNLGFYLFLMVCFQFSYLHADIVPVGAGSYTTSLPAGQIEPQNVIYKTNNIVGPVPTNQWWSSVAWIPYSEALYALPLSAKCTSAGVEISYPQEWYYTQPDNEVSVMRTHRKDFEIRPTAFSPVDARLNKYGDWSVDIQMASGSQTLNMTLAHGSPFVYFTVSSGNLKLVFNGSATVWYGSTSNQVRGITILGLHYGLFAPTGSSWTDEGTSAMTCNLPANQRYFSIAALPDNTPSTLQFFKDHAYAFITDTKANYSYDENSGYLTTQYNISTVKKEGNTQDTIMALCPHQWRNNSLISPLAFKYSSIRGEMKVIAGQNFTTRYSYLGILPYLPNEGSYDLNTLYGLVTSAASVEIPNSDTYWTGKFLGKHANLLPIAEQVAHTQAAANTITKIKATMQNWLSAGSGETKNLFYYNNNWGTLIGYDASYGSNTDLNDHHFHYGYWVFAAAQLALRDKNWAAANQWGGMVNMLIRDYSAWERNDALFPYLRNFDIYEGHCWASGSSKFSDGNNQESSSESMNSHAAMILWGQATGNKSIRDAGIYLWVTELAAIQEYWFDIHENIFPSQYKNKDAGIIWGGKYDHTTWFGDDPAFVHGINALPICAHSLYPGLSPAYPEKNFDALLQEYALLGKELNTWKDVIYSFLATGNAQRASELYTLAIEPEDGETKAHTYHWIYNLKELGNIDSQITADCPLSAVFTKDGKHIYVAYNAKDTAQSVHFSDGAIMQVNANSLGVKKGSSTGKQDLIASFKNYGVWMRNSDTAAWTKLTSDVAAQLAVGDLDGDQKEDLIGVWPSGIWVYYVANNQWNKILDGNNLKWLSAGNLDNDSLDDLIGSWTHGVWMRNSATGSWTKIHDSTAAMVDSGDFDGNGKDDLLGAWDSGIWVKYDSGIWAKILDSADLKYLTAGDMNGDKRDDIVGSWLQGVWFRDSASGTWSRLIDNAEKIAAGDLDGDQKDDLIGVWNSVTGVWVRYSSDGHWEKLNSEIALSIIAGKFR